MFILIVERAVNVAIPLVLGELVSIFEDRSSYSPWFALLGYVGLRYLQGSGGLAAIRDVRSSRIDVISAVSLHATVTMGASYAVFR